MVLQARITKAEFAGWDTVSGAVRGEQRVPEGSRQRQSGLVYDCPIVKC